MKTNHMYPKFTEPFTAQIKEKNSCNLFIILTSLEVFFARMFIMSRNSAVQYSSTYK